MPNYPLTFSQRYGIIELSSRHTQVRNWCIRLAEHCLRGQKAYSWRVMAEWLKTPRVVVSRDYLLDEMDSSRKLVGKSMNPTAGLINFTAKSENFYI
tara:strand:- start:122 stop:412 length:291 start_codon:yes stop_codon:yes gene_type:complete